VHINIKSIFFSLFNFLSKKGWKITEDSTQPIHSVVIITVLMIILAYCYFGLWSYAPVIGVWEQFHFHYLYGAVDPQLALSVAPRANTGGQGYVLVELGYWLSSMFDLSIDSLRALMNIYAIITVVGMIVVFSRWFGLASAILGTSLMVFSMGFVVFSSQTLPMWPSLMLTVLFVERFQVYSTNPKLWGPKICLAILGSLMLTHYAMSRYFLVGWLAYYFSMQFINTYLISDNHNSRINLRELRQQFFQFIGLLLATFVIIDYYNIMYVFRLDELFFPDDGLEIEMEAMKLIPTIIHNIKMVILNFAEIDNSYTSKYPEALLAVQMYPLVFGWHIKLMFLGTIILFRRLFFGNSNVLPYFSLFIICVITIVPTLFSEVGPGLSFLSSRLVGAYFAITGIVIVAISWLWEYASKKNKGLRTFIIVAVVALNIAGGMKLADEKSEWVKRVEERGAIDVIAGNFIDVPETLPVGVRTDNYLQARYSKLASIIKGKFECRMNESILLNINPSILLMNGKYTSTHYMRNYNDFSIVLALYLGQININTTYTLVYDKNDPGKSDRGQGYSGKPRVFSGPIKWEEGKIFYDINGEIDYQIKGSELDKNILLLAFSEEEANGLKIKFMETNSNANLSVVNINQISDFNNITDCTEFKN
jgi:hypothetical protein